MASILIIEDDTLVRGALADAVETMGHSVVEAGNGNEGLARFCERRFDLVVTDIIMPEKEGIETIRELRARAPGLPIVAISGGGRTGNTEFLAIARSLGAAATLTKPIRYEGLCEVIARCLAGSG